MKFKFKYFGALLSLWLCLLINVKGYSQNDEDDGFQFVANEITSKLEILVKEEIDHYRIVNKLDTFSTSDFFSELAADQAVYMALNKEGKSTRLNGKNKTVQQRSKSAGGSSEIDEITFKIPTKKGKTVFTEKEMVSEMNNLIKKNKEYQRILLKNENTKNGVAARLDIKQSNVYICITMGSHKTMNEGYHLRKTMKLPYSKKKRGLENKDVKACANCDKFKDYTKLYDGIYVVKNKIYLKYSNSKNLRKLLKKETDGIAIDIIQKEQYISRDENIINYNLPHRGVLLKPVRPIKIFESIVPNSNKKNPELNIYLGKLPKKLKGDYELNLLVIQNNKVCKTLKRTYVETTSEINNSSSGDYLLINNSELQTLTDFDPRDEAPILSFIVPFEKNKSTFSQADIQPFLDALNEPDFNLQGIYIYSYSSIEGDSVSNQNLQKKRAESIKEALLKIENKKVPTFIKTDDSWNLFKLEVEDTKFEYLSLMKKKDAIASLNNKKILEELEPVLSKGRFARIVLDINYDLSKEKMEKFCLKKIENHLKQNKLNDALKVLEYSQKQIAKGYFYTSFNQTLKQKLKSSNPMFLNNLWIYEMQNKNFELNQNDLEELENIRKSDSSNCVINYNYLNALFAINGFERDIINRISKTVVNCSNLAPEKIKSIKLGLLFNELAAIDTMPKNEDAKKKCLEEIKSVSKRKGSSLNDDISLAKLFNKYKEYEYASEILEPYIKNESINEDGVFTYISSAVQSEKKFYSAIFEKGIIMASNINQKRFCDLFGSPCLSFQVLENPVAKKEFVKKNCFFTLNKEK